MMQKCDVRGRCLVWLGIDKRDPAAPSRLYARSKYQCGFENVGTVDKCPKRRGLANGAQIVDAE